MSAATLLEFGKNPKFGNLDFPDLEKNLEKYLEKIQTMKDLDLLIKSLNPLIRKSNFNDLENQKLKRIRQRAYDKRRNPKFLELVTLPNLESKIPNPKPKIQKNPSSKKVETNKNNSQKEKIDSQVILAEKTYGANATVETPQNTEKGITFDLDYVFAKAPSFLAWLTASALTAYFIWHQSVSLYATAGFDNAIFAATGGLLLVIGSTAYFSITRSLLALLLCIYASGYEGYLMISGTMNDENQMAKKEALDNPELIFLREKADKEMANFKHQEKRYNNPDSKVFENGWFKNNFVTPAWEKSTKAHNAYLAKKEFLLADTKTVHITWLKIFYRLGLVFLCMLFVHRFFASITGNKPA